MNAIGVREIARFLAGTITQAEALDAARAATRRYAKRQYTWFRLQPPSWWPQVESFTMDCRNDILFLSG